MNENMTIKEAYEEGRKVGKGEGHDTPSPETRERIAKLETNQNNLMQEIQEIKAMIKELSNDLKTALECKADKTEIVEIKKDLNNVKQWMWKGIGIVATVLFMASFFREQILSLFK